MSESSALVTEASDRSLETSEAGRLLTHLWRDPHSVPRDLVRAQIVNLQRECEAEPENADLWTCLGIAFAIDFQVHNSMAALSHAVAAQPQHFWARLKLAELCYRLRTLELAEQESAAALCLATTPGQIAVAQKQLQTIRQLRREGTKKPAWSKRFECRPLVVSGMLAMLLLCAVLLAYRPA